MGILRVSKPKQTSFGSMLYYKDSNGKQKRREFATEEEALSFADELEKEIQTIGGIK